MTGMPGIERKFEFDMAVCYCISLTPYAVFFHWVYIHGVQPTPTCENFYYDESGQEY